jgi:hypothetical protein
MPRPPLAVLLLAAFTPAAFSADPPKIADLLAPIGGPPANETPADLMRRAVALFKEAETDPVKYAAAATLFAQAMNRKVEMSPDQLSAWAYCRVRVAAERFNRAKGDPKVAAEVVAEVDAALKLAPDHAGLQQFGKSVLAAAGAGEKPGGPPTGKSSGDGWQMIEAGSFRVRYTGGREFAEALAKKAEEHRTAIFARWSGPPGGAWQPACEIVLYPEASAFAVATKQPAAATGLATVKLDGGRPTERRIDLRTDDPTLLDDALPRELTHVVLADLFPGQAPPRWAVEGMAVLAESSAEVERYLRTVSRCDRGGELFPLASLLELTGLPKAERITGFYVESVSLVDFLVRWKKEKAFTTFLRDYQRYGPESALKRQYGVSSPRQLEELWRRDMQGAK